MANTRDEARSVMERQADTFRRLSDETPDALAQRLHARLPVASSTTRRWIPDHALHHPEHVGWRRTGRTRPGPFGTVLHEITCKEPTL